MVELCIHVANVFYLASFLGRDMLWLRILTCAGLLLGIVFFSCQAAPMYGPTGWHIVFLFINGFMIWRLVAERRQLRLTEEQERIAQAHFEVLSREELLTLLTRVMYANPRRLRDIRQSCRAQLTAEEQVFRDVAFSRLSRKEILNLLTRKLWGSIQRMNPAKLARRRRPPQAGDGSGQVRDGGTPDSAPSLAVADARSIG